MLTPDACRLVGLHVDVATWPIEAQRDALQRAVASRARTLASLTARLPLATVAPWRYDGDDADQAAAIRLAITAPCTVMLGGNRSGKTFGARVAFLILVLGADHPMIAPLLARLGIDGTDLPRGPGVGYVVSASMGASRTSMRDEIDRLLPGGAATWHGQNALAEASVTVAVPGYRQPARIWFKSVDQGHKKFKGTEGRAYLIDEEPEGLEGMRVVEECVRGASTVGGRVIVAATLQSGETWLYRDMVNGGRFNARAIRLISLYNTQAPNYDCLVEYFRGLKSDPWELWMRLLGQPIDRRGAVYPEWRRGDGTREGRGHVCEPFEIPDDWPRFVAADIGQADPTSIAWGALGDDSTLYVYRHLEESHVAYPVWARRMHEAMGATRGEDGAYAGHAEWPEMMWGDSGGVGREALDLWAREGLPFRPAAKAVDAGLSAVRDRLRVRPDGRPRLKVFSTCPKLIHGIEAYRYLDTVRPLRPRKLHDHAVDALRYLCSGLSRLSL